MDLYVLNQAVGFWLKQAPTSLRAHLPGLTVALAYSWPTTAWCWSTWTRVMMPAVWPRAAADGACVRALPYIPDLDSAGTGASAVPCSGN